MDEILKKARVNIISGNPEVLYNGLNNEFLKESYNSKDSIIIPDGIGTIIAYKVFGKKIKNIYNIQDKVIFTYQNEDIAIYEKNNETLKPYIMF